MKFGFRKPSFKKRIAARISLKRYVRHNLGLKAPKGWGWLTNPRKAAYNRIYNRTTKGCSFFIAALVLTVSLFFIAISCEALVFKAGDKQMDKHVRQ